MIDKLLNKISRIRTDYLYKFSPYSTALDDLPPGLYPYWKSTALFEFKGIPRDAFFYVRAAEGLMTYFDCVRHSGKPCGLPSKAADSIWHAWAKFAPANLDRFCVRHFGRTIEHTEGVDMGVAMAVALANSLIAARVLESLPKAVTSVPRLFSLDRRLRMPNGYAWSLEKGQVAHRSMTWQGQEKGAACFLASLAPASMLTAGLISRDEYDLHLKKADANGGSCGSGCGSSCGGGCGGGCG